MVGLALHLSSNSLEVDALVDMVRVLHMAVPRLPTFESDASASSFKLKYSSTILIMAMIKAKKGGNVSTKKMQLLKSVLLVVLG